jgi:hypothetical protein
MKKIDIELSQTTKELFYALKLNPDSKTVNQLIESGLLLKLTTVINSHAVKLKP